MSESRAPETLSDVVARRIVLFRKRRDITRDQLAARCAELGYPELTGPALANIETGRRSKEGKRRRDVTVDELMVLARALHVPPSLLLFPVGDEATVSVVPGDETSPWLATKWLIGEAYFEGEQDTWTVPLFLFRAHDRLRNERLDYLGVPVFGPRDDEALAAAKANAARKWDEIKEVRAEMRRHGLEPPPAVDDLAGIDDRPRLYLTTAEVEERLARGVEVLDVSRPGNPRPMKPGDAQKQQDAIQRGIEFTEQWHRDNPGMIGDQREER